jgi:hypothetical protein
MRYPASEKAEIIQLVEQSHLPANRTLDKLGIPRAARSSQVRDSPCSTREDKLFWPG